MKQIIIQETFLGLLYENGAFIKMLEPGKYKFQTPKAFFWEPIPETIHREVKIVDMRERSLTIKGQEILTKDKVAIRVSILVYFKVTDAVAAMHNVASYENRIYEDVQLSARRYLTSKELETILVDRNGISDAVKKDVLEAAAGYGVEIIRADVKDLIFPGNLRTIMNQVIETERRSQAKLIEARQYAEAKRIQETADLENQLRKLEAEKEQIRLQAEAENEKLKLQLQSQVDIAKAIEENPVLLKLKQLEVLKSLANGKGRFVIGLDEKSLGMELDE
jgi:regulator of protease activity HflC (stomatin/prohibitin superfamily)